MNMLNLSAAPHARDKWTTPFIMRMVTLSLLPATIVGILVYLVVYVLVTRTTKEEMAAYPMGRKLVKFFQLIRIYR